MKRHSTILRREDSLFLIIDYQKKLVNAMSHKEQVTADIVRMIQGMKQLEIPILITEQYAKGLGPTVEDILNEAEQEPVVDKLTFSCCGDKQFCDTFKQYNRKQIIVAGIETHICVLQTVLDLLTNDYEVHVPLSLTCSRHDENRDTAIERMRQEGAIITNLESVFFELMIKAGTTEFKAIQKLIV